MNLSYKGLSNNKDAKMILPNKGAKLNPNAAEFVPSALRFSFGSSKSANVTEIDVPEPSAKATLDQSGSAVSNNSDDEAHQYWCHQLPDDITPDFKSMGEDDLQTPEQLPLVDLSLHEGIETSRFSALTAGQLLGARQEISPGIGGLDLGEKTAYSGSVYVENQPSSAFMSLATNKWEKHLLNGNQYFMKGREGHHYNGDSSAGLIDDSLSEHAVLEDANINPVEFLSAQFPGFAAESLADVYYANGCDLNLTIEILTQLELQVDVDFSQNQNSKALEAPSFNVMDFPALSAAEAQNGMPKLGGEDLQQAHNTFRSPSSIPRGAIDFASTVRRLASQDSGHRKYERSGPAEGSVGSSRSSQLLTNSYDNNAKLAYGDKLRSASTVRAAPVWLETGEAVANMYSELREEARDFARIRNAYFEQARQAYLIGNGALARELSRKGQLYNMQMKAAHGKARETIYRQRNPAALEARMQDRLIDLHGLHVNEAINVLEHELCILKRTARAAGQRLQVLICVGTGHHTKGARTPARLPVAVEQFLLEEGLHFTQPQPGLLRVVI